MKYSGIDLHSNNSVVVVINENDRVIVSKRMPNQLPGIIELLRPYQNELAGVVVESTYNWYWLVDGLQDAGFVVHLASSSAIVGSYRDGAYGNTLVLAQFVSTMDTYAQSGRSVTGFSDGLSNWTAPANTVIGNRVAVSYQQLDFYLPAITEIVAGDGDNEIRAYSGATAKAAMATRSRRWRHGERSVRAANNNEWRRAA